MNPQPNTKAYSAKQELSITQTQKQHSRITLCRTNVLFFFPFYSSRYIPTKCLPIACAKLDAIARRYLCGIPDNAHEETVYIIYKMGGLKVCVSE